MISSASDTVLKETSVSETMPSVDPALGAPLSYGGFPQESVERVIRPVPERYRNALGKYKVNRSAACVACGQCVRSIIIASGRSAPRAITTASRRVRRRR